MYPEAIWIICPIRLSAVFNSVEKNCLFISVALNLVSDYQSQNNDVMDATNFAGMQVINSLLQDYWRDLQAGETCYGETVQ